MTALKVVEANTPAQKKNFIQFPYKIYENNPHWVAPLQLDMRQMFDIRTPFDRFIRKRHPFYDYGEMQAFLAYRASSLVGRICAVGNSLYKQHHDSQTGFWGFFECIDDQEVADTLFQAAEKWLKKKGFSKMKGPASPSSTYDYGLLVEGFDDSPRVMMTYNPKYYVKLIETAGFDKLKQLYAYKISADTINNNKKLARVVVAIKKRYAVEMQPINMKDLKNEVEKIRRIYNESWNPNWGHIPFTDKEIEMLAEGIKPVAEANLILFCYVRNQLAGMAVAVRDVNFLLKRFKGRLFPFNLFKLMNKKNLKKTEWMRVLLLGLLPQFQGKGIDAAFYWDLIQNSLNLGLRYCEASWILEDNTMMNRAMDVVSGVVYKRYNLYTRPIG